MNEAMAKPVLRIIIYKVILKVPKTSSLIYYMTSIISDLYTHLPFKPEVASKQDPTAPQIYPVHFERVNMVKLQRY